MSIILELWVLTVVYDIFEVFLFFYNTQEEKHQKLKVHLEIYTTKYEIVIIKWKIIEKY